MNSIIVKVIKEIHRRWKNKPIPHVETIYFLGGREIARLRNGYE